MAATAPPPSLATPPTAPEVADQQGPISQYIQNYQGGQDGQQGQAPGTNAAALVEQKLNQVAALLKDVAQVLVNYKPHVMPVLQKSLQALSMVMNEVQQGKQGQQQGQPGVQRQAPPEAAPPQGGEPQGAMPG